VWQGQAGSAPGYNERESLLGGVGNGNPVS